MCTSRVQNWGYLGGPCEWFFLIKFTVKRASKQHQTLHMEGKLHVILYFMEEWPTYTEEYGDFFIWKITLFYNKIYFTSLTLDSYSTIVDLYCCSLWPGLKLLETKLPI